MFAGIVTVFILACSHLAAFAVGDWHGATATMEAAAEIVKTNARRATPAANPPPQLLKCDDAGLAEFKRCVKARYRSGMVGPK